MLTEEIKSLISELYQATPDYVGVGLGYKVQGGEQTDKESIVFFVPSKKPKYAIPAEEVLPDTEFVLGDRVLVTDVVEIGEVKAFACNPACYTWQTVPPANRTYIRPIKGGISLTSKTKLGTVGTLGAIVVDVETNALVGLTNNHVVIKDAFYADQRNPSGVIENEYDIVDGGVREPDFAYQPGETSSPPPNYTIGQVVRYVPIYASGGVNKVDGALVSVGCDPITSVSESFKQFGLSYAVPMQFATTAEINALLSSNPMLFSSGRTTGVKQGPPCPLRTYAVGVTIPVGGYKLQGSTQVVTFQDTIQFVRPVTDPVLAPQCLYPIYPGDSGSVLIADFDGTSKIIGLNFAGSDFFAFACRIDSVAAELGIKAWDGTNKPVVDEETIDYITVPGLNDIKTQTCESKTYWQVGISNLTKSCSGLTSFELLASYTDGSVVASYTLVANQPAPYDYIFSFTNYLETETSPQVSFSVSMLIEKGGYTATSTKVSPVSFSSLTKQVEFLSYTLTPLGPFEPFLFEVNVNPIFPPVVSQTPTPTPTVTPTPTPTAGPTPTPTPTPSVTPEPLIVYYDVSSCTDFTVSVAKFVLPPPYNSPEVGKTYYLNTNIADSNNCYNVIGISVGPEDFTVVNSTGPFDDCITCLLS